MRIQNILALLLIMTVAVTGAFAQALTQDTKPSSADLSAMIGQVGPASMAWPIPVSTIVPMDMPAGPNAWVLHIVSGGGYTGLYKETAVDSQRNVRCSTKIPCPGRLSRRQLQSFSMLLSESALSKWREVGIAPVMPSVCSDCIRVWMELRHRDQDGKEKTYYISSDTLSAPSLPSEVKKIYETAAAFRR